MMSKISNKMKITTLSAGLALALTTGAISTTVIAAQAGLSDEVKAAQANKISLQQAITIAAKQASGSLVGVDYDDDDDDAQGGVYELEFSTATTSYEVNVDAITGAILSTDTERLDNDDINDYNVQQRAKVNMMRAINIAESQTNAKVIEIEFEDDRDYNDHPQYYKTDLLKGNEIIVINIDASTGATFANKYAR